MLVLQVNRYLLGSACATTVLDFLDVLQHESGLFRQGISRCRSYYPDLGREFVVLVHAPLPTSPLDAHPATLGIFYLRLGHCHGTINFPWYQICEELTSIK